MSALNPDRPLIIIGVPCYDKVAPEILEDWMRWAYHLGRRMPAYDFQIGIVTKKEQFRARNLLVEEAMRMQAAYLLMIDDDMIINPYQTFGSLETGDSAYNFIETLIGHGKDICGVLYYQRMAGCHPVLMAGHPDHAGFRFLRDDEITGGLQDVDVAGGGCLLLNMRIFRTLKAPFFVPEVDFGTDVQLCKSARAAGFTVAADTSIELGHLRNEQVIITGRNRSMFALADTVPGEVRRDFDSVGMYTQLEQDACAYTGYRDIHELTANAETFMLKRASSGLSDPDWYRQYPRERVARQVWFNTLGGGKRNMTEFILSQVDHRQPLDILDFGCGIGIPAHFFAARGHRVTACDVRGTGTLEFLAWRAERDGLPISLLESEGGIPDLGDRQFDVIVAMDVIEHIQEWREIVPYLAAHLKPQGVLFANNAILEDVTHPEHYVIGGTNFVKACAEAGLLPLNQICYTRHQAPPVKVATEKELTRA